jgi:hypothetical protein
LRYTIPTKICAKLAKTWGKLLIFGDASPIFYISRNHQTWRESLDIYISGPKEWVIESGVIFNPKAKV